MLDLEDDLTVVGQAGTCAEVVALAVTTTPDVALLDARCPPAACPSRTASTPWPCCAAPPPDAHVLVVTTFARPGYLRRALEGGAR